VATSRRWRFTTTSCARPGWFTPWTSARRGHSTRLGGGSAPLGQLGPGQPGPASVGVAVELRGCRSRSGRSLDTKRSLAPTWLVGVPVVQAGRKPGGCVSRPGLARSGSTRPAAKPRLGVRVDDPLDELHRPPPLAVGGDVGPDPLRRLGDLSQVDAEQLSHARKGCGDQPRAPAGSTRTLPDSLTKVVILAPGAYWRVAPLCIGWVGCGYLPK
jgi:hypothetical protein